MSGIRKRFATEKRMFQRELKEGMDELLGLDRLPTSFLYGDYESDEEEYERMYKEDVVNGLFDDYEDWDMYEFDPYSKYEDPYEEEDYDLYDPNDDFDDDYWNDPPFPYPGDHVRTPNGETFLFTDYREFVSLLTGRYANPWPYEIIWNGR